MSTLKEIYFEYYPKLIRVLPMTDAYFVARLYSSRFLPGDAKESVAARPTRAERATYFLDNYINTAFEDDGSNPRFLELLNVMTNSEDMVLKSVSTEIKTKCARM